MNDERKQWLKEQLADKSECQLFNFGMQNDKNCGWDIHGDVVDLLAENEALKKELIDERRKHLEHLRAGDLIGDEEYQDAMSAVDALLTKDE